MTTKKNTTQHIVHQHRLNAFRVKRYAYFLINRESFNGNAGLLIGTAVRKIKDPEMKESKFWAGCYWTAVVETPSKENRRVSVDCLTPTLHSDAFEEQTRVFRYHVKQVDRKQRKHKNRKKKHAIPIGGSTPTETFLEPSPLPLG